MRRYWGIVALALAFLALAGVYFGMMGQNADPAATGQLYRFAPGDSLRQITLTNAYGGFTFAKQAGKWAITRPAQYRANQQKVNVMESFLLDLPIKRVLDAERAEYGLARPQAVISLVTGDGISKTLSVGNLTPSQAQVYLKDAASGHVFVSDTGAISQFDGSLNAFRDKEVFAVDKANIAGLTYYKDGQKQVAVARAGPQDWRMTYPYAAPARHIELNEFVARMRDWTIASYPGQGDPDTAGMGLDRPAHVLEVADTAGNTQRLEFGKAQDGMIYVRTGSAQDIARLFAVDADFSALAPDRLVFLTPLRATIDQVARIDVAYGERQATFEVDHTTQPPRITGGGKTLPYAEFLPFFVAYVGLSADGRDPSRPAGDVAMTLTTTRTDGSTATLELRQRDDDSLYMVIDGKPEYSISKAKTSQLVDRLEAALAARK